MFCRSLFVLLYFFLLAIVLSVLLRYTDSDYSFDIFWPLCCLFFFDIRILITPLISFGHCVVCSSSIYGFWLLLWYLLAIVLSVLLRYTDSDYSFDIFWPLCCLFFDIRILITPLISFGHCVVCSSSIYGFWLHFDIFWPLCCLFFFDIRILITPLISFGHCVVCSSIYGFWLPFDIFWPLCCLFFDIRILITPLISFGHCVVCSSSIYGFWLLLWYLLAIVLSVLRYTDSDYSFDIFWPLCCLFFFDIRILITPLISFGHCVVCSSSIYGFWLLLWYLLAIVLSVLRYTDSDYPLISFGHCVVCSSIYGFWLLLWYLLAIVLSVLRYTDSDYSFDIFWPLCCLFFDIRILITPLISVGHCVVCSSSIYGFWLLLWYLLAIVLSVLLRYTDSDYSFDIFWPLCCLFFFDIRILITPLISFGHCVVCSSSIYGFWLLLWYLLAIVLSVLLRYTDSDYSFDIFWPLCCLFFFDIRILITPLISFGHCVVCSSSIYGFWLLLWYLLAIVLSVLLRYTDSDYSFDIFWPLCCLFLFDIRILITPLISFGHCVVCSSSIYGFWLLLWYLLAIVLSVLRYTDSDYSFDIFWPLCCLFFFDIRILITLWYLLAIVLSVLLRYTDSDYSFDIFWPLCCLFFDIRILITLWYLLAIVLSVLRYTDSDYSFDIFWPLCCLFFFDIRILITPLISFGHCVVCSSIYGFWLLLWYLLAIVLSVLLRYTDSDYSFDIFWPLCCLFFFDIRILITPLISFGHCVVCSSIYGFWLPFDIFWPLCCLFFDIRILITPLISFGHCVVCSSIYGFWLLLWYLLAIVLSVLRYTDSDYSFDIFWPLCCLFFDIRILITPSMSFGHCVVCSSSIYGFWLLLWYLLAIVLSVLLRYTDSDYSFDIFWPLCCLFFFDIRILITPLISFGHCVVCSSSIYGFWLLLWYLLAIVLSVLLRYTDSDYSFDIFWPLCCLFFFDIRILITPLISFGHCVVCSSSIYGFWLLLWYLLAIVLSVRLRYTDSDYSFDIFWPLCCLFFFDIRILITPLISFGHCVVCSSSIYGFWLLLWYLLAIVLSVLLRYTDSDYSFDIFWPLCCLFFDIRILITPLISFGHCVVCSSSIYGFWLPFDIFWPLCCLFFFDIRILITLWYLLAIVLSVLLRYTDSDYLPLISSNSSVWSKARWICLIQI